MLAGCNLSLASSASGVPDAWIDAPLNGATLPLGPVDVVWHAAASKGVDLVEFGVNGAPVEAAPPGNVEAGFVTGTRTSSPPAASFVVPGGFAGNPPAPCRTGVISEDVGTQKKGWKLK